MNRENFENFRNIHEIWDEIEREDNLYTKGHTLRRAKGNQE